MQFQNPSWESARTISHINCLLCFSSESLPGKGFSASVFLTRKSRDMAGKGRQTIKQPAVTVSDQKNLGQPMQNMHLFFRDIHQMEGVLTESWSKGVLISWYFLMPLGWAKYFPCNRKLGPKAKTNKQTNKNKRKTNKETKKQVLAVVICADMHCSKKEGK